MISSVNTKGTREVKKYKLRMSREGMIVYDPEELVTYRLDQKETSEALKRHIDYNSYDYVCEVAHLEISNTCKMKCKYCYVPNKKGKELPTRDWKKIIDNLASAGIFQVSFGGGEPTERKDLFELAEYVNRAGLNLAMTTNGTNLKRIDPIKLKKYFKQINVSWHGNPTVFEEALEHLMITSVPTGINYTFTKAYARDNDMIKFLADEYDTEILYLVYKPVMGDIENQVPKEEVYKAAKQSANEGLRVAVDGPCINRCLMKRKFIDVDHLGNVYPCSFVRKPLGNLLKTDFKEIWKNRGEQDECPYVELKENTSGKSS